MALGKHFVKQLHNSPWTCDISRCSAGVVTFRRTAGHYFVLNVTLWVLQHFMAILTWPTESTNCLASNSYQFFPILVVSLSLFRSLALSLKFLRYFLLREFQLQGKASYYLCPLNYVTWAETFLGADCGRQRSIWTAAAADTASSLTASTFIGVTQFVNFGNVNTFAASYLNTQGLNNSCLKSPA